MQQISGTWRTTSELAMGAIPPHLGHLNTTGLGSSLVAIRALSGREHINRVMYLPTLFHSIYAKIYRETPCCGPPRLHIFAFPYRICPHHHSPSLFQTSDSIGFSPSSPSSFSPSSAGSCDRGCIGRSSASPISRPACSSGPSSESASVYLHSC